MNFDNCFEIFPISIIIFCVFSFSKYFKRSQIFIKLLTSPLDPFAIYKNFTNCLFDCNSNPSAIFNGIDKAAL